MGMNGCPIKGNYLYIYIYFNIEITGTQFVSLCLSVTKHKPPYLLPSFCHPLDSQTTGSSLMVIKAQP